MVTGGSDGIGYALCQKLADEGFNICIIDRDEKKMEDKLELLKKNSVNKDLETMCIVANFALFNSIDSY